MKKLKPRKIKKLDLRGAESSQVALLDKNLPVTAGDVRDSGSISGPGTLPGGGSGTPFQYSCQENPMDRGAWLATAFGVTKSWKCLSI